MIAMLLGLEPPLERDPSVKGRIIRRLKLPEERPPTPDYRKLPAYARPREGGKHPGSILSAEQRVKIVDLLGKGGELRTPEIAIKVKLSRSQVETRITELAKLGMLASRREKATNHVFWRLK